MSQVIFDATGTPSPELGVFLYQADLKKEDGTALVAADFSTPLAITVYNRDAAKTIINGLDNIPITTGSRGSINAQGHLSITLAGADLPILDTAVRSEDHDMLIEGAYATGTRFTRHVVRHRVVNLEKTP